MKSLRADILSMDSCEELSLAHVDITGAVEVETIINERAKTLHVNVNGICVLRICRIQKFANGG